MTIHANIIKIRESIDKTAKTSPLSAGSIAILAASKGQNQEAIEEAISAGLAYFGENRVQEADGKWAEIKKRHPHIVLHLIGPLQTNKVKEAIGLFDVIQTLDREKLANAIAKELGLWSNEVMERKNTTPPLHNSTTSPRFYIQVNTGEEPQKAGVSPKEADHFIRYCRDDLKLPVVGLMCVPPADQPPAPHFALLREIANRNGLKELSMGMSGDYEAAVRMGSTCVRIGTALFGERK